MVNRIVIFRAEIQILDQGLRALPDLVDDAVDVVALEMKYLPSGTLVSDAFCGFSIFPVNRRSSAACLKKSIRDQYVLTFSASGTPAPDRSARD